MADNSSSVQQARHHVAVAMAIEREARTLITESVANPSAWDVCLAGHGQGRHAEVYRNSEKASGGKFWSIYSRSALVPSMQYMKPDAVIVNGLHVASVIEVKWGAAKGCTGTDATERILTDDIFKIARTRQAVAADGVQCHIRGPIVKNGWELPSVGPAGQFTIDDDTQFLLVVDLQSISSVLGRVALNQVLRILKQADGKCLCCTPGERVGDIPSFKEIFGGLLHSRQPE